MKCPYCEKKMKRGAIQSAREIFWSNYKRRLFFRPNIDKGDVSIAPFGLNGTVKEAYLCKNCKKVIND